MATFQTESPATGEKLETHTYLTDGELEAILARVFAAYQSNLRISSDAAYDLTKSAWANDRRARLGLLTEVLRREKDSLARIMALEMGKPLSAGIAEIEKSAAACEFYFENFFSLLSAEHLKYSKANSARVIVQPQGPLYAIMPWNFPLWQVVRALLPNFVVGNPVILKHSNVVAGSAKKMTSIFHETLGAANFQNLVIDHDTSARVIADPRVRGVTLTGSEAAGRVVGEQAGRSLKKSVLELGGNDPSIILPDADLDLACETGAQMRLLNTGQSCICTKRFFVPQKIKDIFLEKFTAAFRKAKFGPPLETGVSYGPLAQVSFKKNLVEQVAKLQREPGVQHLWSDERQDFDFSKAAFFAPEIYAVSKDTPSFTHGEFFGPVALVYFYADVEDAIALANASVYGLGGSVFSRDLDFASRTAARLECGMVAINDMLKSDGAVPFGGTKFSGYGREVGRQGIHEFSLTKAIFDRI